MRDGERGKRVDGGMGRVVIPAGEPGPVPFYRWCEATPWHVRRANQHSFSTRWAFRIGHRDGWYHADGRCPRNRCRVSS